jgi:hypothetical protein
MAYKQLKRYGSSGAVPATETTLFEVPSGATWIVQHFAFRITAVSGAPDHIIRVRDSANVLIMVINTDAGIPSVGTISVDRPALKGMVLAAGDKITHDLDNGASPTLSASYHLGVLEQT